MSDLMLYGVLEMPFPMAMSGEIAQYQFWSRAQEAAKRLKAAEARLAELDRAPVSTPQQSAQRASVEDDKAFWALAAAWANSRGTVRDHLAKQALIAHINAWGSAGSGAKAGWIDVNERLPKHVEDDAIYVWASWNGTAGFPAKPQQGEARYIKSLGWQPKVCQGWDWNVTHWMPLPAAPSPAPQGEQA